MTHLFDSDMVKSRNLLGAIATEAAAAMFGLQLEAADDANFDDAGLKDGHAVLVHLHGNPDMFMGLACDRKAGMQLASVVFEVSPDHVDPAMANDVLCELANIFAGQVKVVAASEHYLGLPRVFSDPAIFAGHHWYGVRLRIGSGDEMLDFAVAA